ncbi:bcl-2-modifying factor isoform X1 [Mauremys mutica]|uniref:bcl-2-modifying factor-like isoform X1 n=1 Tax=Mauremys mutica TaxID=74926 RepID=UPI001D154659|nr:bcl-2-modifying factor-like isoform X1 [Mauremys mutica]XP_044856087.1 bcl-2-modifying factor-like isoform X1 [Mauremys mutica]XP_044872314.1 bcl-2-modifying factor isoform X1 [Mauremys mutica]XP_044872315.1 bcl-2-modifying factor isoform X1 [Mauremys mutica]
MDPPSYLEEDYSSLDGLDDDVFHSDFGLTGQPGEMTPPGIFTQNQSYSCLLGRFQLFPLTHCCGPGIRHAEQQDKATQTLSPSSSTQDVMLPCGVTEEPQRLFYGNAGYRLHVPPVGFALNPHLQEEPREGQREARAEVQIARKLQCIADQFHRLHIQRHQQNRNQVWWQILLFIHNLALNVEANRNHVGQSLDSQLFS